MSGGDLKYIIITVFYQKNCTAYTLFYNPINKIKQSENINHFSKSSNYEKTIICYVYEA